MTISEYLLRYGGFGAESGICHVVVAQNGGPAVVLAGSPKDNPGTSVTNALEQVAAEISTQILGGARDFQLYQYEPEGLPDLKPTFYRIVWTPKAFRMPQWVPVTPENEPRLAPLAEVLPEPEEYKVAELRRRPRLKAVQPKEPGGPVKPELTIGELFPADDVVAHWVFTLTALAEDLTAVTAFGRQVTSEEPDIGIGLQYMRQLVTRLYEARRLIEVTEAEPEVTEFIDRIAGEKNTWLEFLRQVYGPQQESERSVIEELFGELRHATVHYSWVGSKELRDRLREASWMPARMLVEREPTRVDFQWVQAVSAWQLFQVTSDPDWYAAYERRHRLAGSVASAWIMLSSVALLIYMHDRGIAVERLGDPPSLRRGETS